MVRVLTTSLMVLLGYIAIAIVIGAARDSNLNWIAMVGVWSGAAFVFLVPLFTVRVIQVEGRMAPVTPLKAPFLAALGALSLGLAYGSINLYYAKITKATAFHWLISTYAGRWSVTAVLILIGLICFACAYDAYPSSRNRL